MWKPPIATVPYMWKQTPDMWKQNHDNATFMIKMNLLL